MMELEKKRDKLGCHRFFTHSCGSIHCAGLCILHLASSITFDLFEKTWNGAVGSKRHQHQQ